jgi:pyocin large subunit-like protein
MPFANELERAIHFAKHGHEFGASTEIDHERMADAFLSHPMTMTMRECIRPNRLDACG